MLEEKNMPLTYCPNCGFKLTPNAKFCADCGSAIPVVTEESPAEGIALQQMSPATAAAISGRELAVQETHIIHFCGRDLAFDTALMERSQLVTCFSENCRQCQADFDDFYLDSVHCFDDLYEKALPYYIQAVAGIYRFTTRILEQHGMFISDDTLLAYVSREYDVESTLSFYADISNRLSDFLEQLASYRASKRSTQYTWGSVGFGLKGAITGAITASALNLGTQFVRGVAHDIVDAADKARFEKVKAKIFREGGHMERLSSDLVTLSSRLCNTAYALLVSQGYMELCTVDTAASQYKGQRAYAMAEGADAGDLPQQQNEIIDLACQAIQADPQTMDAYLALYRTLDDKSEVSRLARFLGVEQTYLAAKDAALSEIMEKLDAEPAQTPKDFDEKIEQLEQIHFHDPEKNSCIHQRAAELITKYQTEKQALIEQEEMLRQKAIKEAEEEAVRQAALAEAQARASIWQERLERDKSQASELIGKVQQHMNAKDLAAVWKLTGEPCIYAEYMLTEYYLEAIAPAIDGVNADKFNQVTASIRHYVKQGNLFAKYLLSFCSMLFWMDAIDDEEKAAKMMNNCVKAAERGCISAMAAISELSEVFESFEIPGISKRSDEFLRIAAENQHPIAMWSYGTMCKKRAGSDLEQQAKADYFQSMAKFYGYIPPKSQKGTSSSSGCFITSAVCRTFGRADDCYELNLFRAFRDEWLAKQPDGPALIAEYYQVAPAIVAVIDRHADSGIIYQSIWDNYLQPCLHDIEAKEYFACKSGYVDMVNSLKQRYLARS